MLELCCQPAVSIYCVFIVYSIHTICRTLAHGVAPLLFRVRDTLPDVLGGICDSQSSEVDTEDYHSMFLRSGSLWI